MENRSLLLQLLHDAQDSASDHSVLDSPSCGYVVKKEGVGGGYLTEVEVSVLDWNGKRHRPANKPSGKTNNELRGRPKSSDEQY